MNEDKKTEILKGLSDLFNSAGLDSDLKVPDHILASVAYDAVLSYGQRQEEESESYLTGILRAFSG